jgi:tRNA-2-methylthio-N6-dimethylallyladenosine synthase
MKRTYTIEKYRRIIDQIREKIPNVAVTTDMIVGFCGETEAEFENTLEAFRQIQFDQAFMFAYSPRHTTESWNWPDDVPAETKQRRLAELIALQNEIARDKNRKRVGEREEVLVEGVSNKDASRLMGRTRTNKLVLFPGSLDDYAVGSLVEVETKEAFLWGFVGEATRALGEMNRPRTLMQLQMV